MAKNRLFSAPFIGLVLVWGSFAAAYAQPQAANTKKTAPLWRNYSDGKLTDADFRGENPDPVDQPQFAKMNALVTTEFSFKYRWKSRITKEQTTAELIEIHFIARLDQNRSWNRLKGREEADLLDHEQGHFDLAEIYAGTLNNLFAQRLKDRKEIEFVGTDESDATEKMRKALQALCDKYGEELRAENRVYDKETTHGLNAAKQREHRRVQKERLAKVAEERKRG